MKKTMLKIMTAAFTAAAMLAPLPAYAFSAEDAVVPEGYSPAGNCKFLEEIMYYYVHGNTSDFYVNNDGTQFIGVKQMSGKSTVFKLAENVKADDINNAISELYNGEYGDYLLGGRYSETSQSAWVSINKLDPEKAIELSSHLKEKHLIIDCMIIDEIQQAQEIFTKGIGYYNDETYDASIGSYIDTETVIKPIVENELSGYTIGFVTDTTTAGANRNYYVLNAPEGTPLSERLEAAEKIYEATGVSIASETSYMMATSNSNINVYDYVKYDANCDGRASIADSVAILQNIGNKDKYKLSVQGEFNADTDFDGITAADALAIQMLDSKGSL